MRVSPPVHSSPVISQEARLQPSPALSWATKAVRYYLHPVTSRLTAFVLQRVWARHADPRRLDWDWTRIGYNRAAVVSLLAARLEHPAYLEIGCDENQLFGSVPARRKVGVDPRRGGTIRATSDAFFRTNTEKFDLIFIDGLHTYEQVRRDLISALACLKPGGWILLHDMLPRDWTEQHIPIVARHDWTGDVWKVGFELAQTAGIDFRILKLDYGVGVLRLQEGFTGLADLRATLADKQFGYYCDHLDRLPIVDWDEAESWLRS